MKYEKWEELTSMSRIELKRAQTKLSDELNVVKKLLEVESKRDEIKEINDKIYNNLEKEFGE